MHEMMSELQANNVFSHIQQPFRGALCCIKKPRCRYTERSTQGCFGGSVVIGGYRKVVNGAVCIGGLKLTHENLHELEGLYVSLTAKEWMCTEYGIFGVPFVKLTDAAC